MDDTEKSIRQPEPTAESPAAPTLRDSYYRPLVRLAALLTGDADSAEAVACEALAVIRSTSPRSPEASADVLRHLQRRVLVRSRRIRRATEVQQPRGGAQPPVTSCEDGSASSAQPSAADFACLPVVRALQDLPRRGREAVVLTHYLDLSEQQAALVAGVTPTALRRFLREALRVLDAQFPAA